MLLIVLQEICPPRGGVGAQFTNVDPGVRFDVVHIEMAVAVVLLLELAVTDVALVEHCLVVCLLGLHLQDVLLATLALAMTPRETKLSMRWKQ